MAPAPSDSTFLAHWTASRPAPWVPPRTITSKPDGNAGFFAVSMATVIFSLPNSSAASRTRSGLRTAAVFIETLDTPMARSSSIPWQLLMPPPTVSGTLMRSTVRRTASSMVFRFSMVAVMSRKTSSSAPAWL
jgi:hypothetical protein